MSYLIRVEIICDTCKVAYALKCTPKASEVDSLVRSVRDDFAKSGGSQVLRGRYRTSAHYCRECQDKGMGKPEGLR